MVTVWFDTGHRRQFMTVQEAVQFCDEEVEANVVEITDDAGRRGRLLGGAARCMRLSVDTLRKAWAARLLNWGLLPVFHEKPAARSDGPMLTPRPHNMGHVQSRHSQIVATFRCVRLEGHRGCNPGRRRQGDDAKDARTDTFGDGLDRAALAGTIAPLENDADLQALVHHPLLNLDQLDMQPGQLSFVVLDLQLAVGAPWNSRQQLGFLAFFVALIMTSHDRVAACLRPRSRTYTSRALFGQVKNRPTSPGIPPG